MFKKPFKVSNQHSVSNKDKKKMREKLVQKQGYSVSFADYILNDENFDDESSELRVSKIMGTRLAYYSRGQNPLFFSQDSDKLTTNVPLEPSLYVLFTHLTL